MKIAIDLRPLMGGNTSGVELYLRRMLEVLMELDPTNEYLLWWNAFGKIEIPGLPPPSARVRLRQTRWPNRLLNLCLSLLRWPKIDRLIGERIDALWVPDPRPAPVSAHCRKLITFHDLSFHDFPSSFNFKTRLWHKLLRPKKEAREADRIIAVSRFTQTRLTEAYGLPLGKISALHEASPILQRDLQRTDDWPAIRGRYGLPDGPYFLCLSTLEPRKNLKGVLQAYALYRSQGGGVPLVIAGKLRPDIFARFDLPACEGVLFTGFVEEAHKPALYRHALAFLYLSLYEGFGLPILEAMHCGTPVLCSNRGAMAEVAGRGAFLVDPKDEAALARAMARIERDGDLRLHLIRQGRLRAKEFSWKDCGRGLLELLSSQARG